MPNPIMPVPSRPRQDVADGLTPDAIRDAYRQAGHRWRNRKLDPVATLGLFLIQTPHGNATCLHVVRFAG